MKKIEIVIHPLTIGVHDSIKSHSLSFLFHSKIGFALVCTCVVLKVNFKHPSHGDMPEWFRDIVLHRMAKLFRMMPEVKMAESQKKHFEKAKRKPSIFATWIPRFSVTRFYNPRGSVPGGESSKRSKMKQSSVENIEEVEKIVEDSAVTINKDEEDKYIALTGITVQNKDVLLQDNRSSLPHCSFATHEETETSPGTNGGDVINNTRVPDVLDDPSPQNEDETENANGLPPVSYVSPGHSYFTDEKVCLACSHNSAIHSLVQQQEDLVKHVESLADMARDMEEEEIKKEEWKLAAAVLDEFFFWLYLFMLIISNAVVFSKIPKYDD